MDILRSKIIKIVKAHGQDEEVLLQRLEILAIHEGDRLYQVLLSIFTQLDFPPEVAHNTWSAILVHRADMSRCLDRPVNLSTAICDYFLTVKKEFTYPKVVELKLFEEVQHYSRSDHLTGLYNRGYFEEALHHEISRSKRYGTEFSLLFFDIDNFKQINDSIGHLAGDRVLKKIARLLLSEKRAEDVAARYGGEELVLVLPETNKANSLIKAERIRRGIEAMWVESAGREHKITVSGGIATYPHDATSAEDLVACADKALYQAKAAGKNRIQLYSIEKRQYVRMDFAGPVVVQPLGHQFHLERQEVFSKDLSLSGMLFESARSIEVGHRVQLQVPIPSVEHPLVLVGTVVRVESLDSGKWDIGISFVQLRKQDQGEIAEYLKQFSVTTPVSN